MDDTALRENMVKTQLLARGIRNPSVLQAFRDIPRHMFVPPELQAQAYDDSPLPIGLDQTISQPFTVAFMTQALKPESDKTVLEIGTGSGYQTAILARVFQHVYSIERHAPLYRRAADILEELEIRNVTLLVGDGTRGWPEYAPYDAIMVTAGSPIVPEPLVEQLSEDEGRLIIPVGRNMSQEMTLIRKTAAGIAREHLGGFTFVPLIGQHGWAEH
jgi:protein-L-isoaspartate(D-aspartate) O-methyltransferase